MFRVASPPSEPHPGPRPRASRCLLASGLALALCAMRLLQLDADLPAWVSPHNQGEYVDEGYKTLSPRNLLLFGSTHWHPLDDYPGWMETSPLPSWSYYAAFRALGVRIESARAVSALYFAAFLACFLALALRRYALWLVLGGLVLLGADSTLFFFSRIALFEMPLIFLLYGLVFAFARREAAVWTPIVGALALAPLLAFGVKLSAFLYVAPILGGLVLRALYLRGPAAPARWRTPWLWLGAGAAALAAGLFLFATRGEWLYRINLSPPELIMSLLENPMRQMSPFLILGGSLCAVHLLLCCPERVLASAYRTAVLSIALIAPLGLALFPNDPPRYYVPVLPAYGLAMLEWFHLRGPKLRPAPAGAVVGLAAIAAIALWGCTAARAFDALVIAQLPIRVREYPGLGDRLLARVALPAALFTAAALWHGRERWLRGALVAPIVLACVGFAALHSAIVLGTFQLAPIHQGSALRAALVRRIPPGSTLIGDWAPFLALGTDLHALYMNDRYNVAARVAELRPQYFVYSNTPQSNLSLAQLGFLEDVRLGAPLFASQYNERSVVLYPIEYGAPAPERRAERSGQEPPPLHGIGPRGQPGF